jgi:hypothetical protein
LSTEDGAIDENEEHELLRAQRYVNKGVEWSRSGAGRRGHDGSSSSSSSSKQTKKQPHYGTADVLLANYKGVRDAQSFLLS